MVKKANNNSLIVNDFIEFVKIDSESLNEKKFVEFLINKFKTLKPDKIIIDEAGKSIKGNTGNLIIKFNGKGKSKNFKPLLLAGHLDTVKPGVNITPVLKNNFVVTDNNTILGADDKVAVVSIFHALKNIISDNKDHPPLEILFTVAEEIGLLGAKHLNIKNIKSKYAYVFDADGKIGTIITKAPTHITFKVSIFGKEAHAGINPESGKNSIKIAAEIISKIQIGKIAEHTTANIGIIQGGIANNIVPKYTEFQGEFRSINENNLTKMKKELNNIINETKKKHKVKINISYSIEYKKMNVPEKSVLIKNFVNTIKLFNRKHFIKATTGGSDASILNKKGIETVNIGVEFINPHSVKEKIKTSTLYSLTALIENLILNWNIY